MTFSNLKKPFHLHDFYKKIKCIKGFKISSILPAIGHVTNCETVTNGLHGLVYSDYRTMIDYFAGQISVMTIERSPVSRSQQ